jgi:ferritin-like protein
MHRAIISLMEELEAIDWYQQRADVTPNADLKAIMQHNRDEEIEHAMMTLEWIRRTNPTFDTHMRTYLFSEGPITEVEAKMKAAEAGGAGGGPKAPSPGAGTQSTSGGSLGVGSIGNLDPAEGV